MIGPTEVRRVVLVVLDGLRPDAVDRFDLTHVRGLSAASASTMSARTVTPSVTAAAMASIFSGVPPAYHGLESDRFHIPRSRGPMHLIPRLLADAGQPTSAFIHHVPFLYAALAKRIARHVGVTKAHFGGECAEAILAAAQPTLEQQRRGLIMLHWPDADRAGHEHGWMSAGYERGARALDASLGTLVAQLDLARDPATLLIAFSDHGGGGAVYNDHDSDHPLDQTIMCMLAGAAVEPRELTGPVSLLDIPATILWSLGVARPASYAGRALIEGFQPAVAAA
jgi:predicted AlkP superfamily pyrophosphatase or phosphodiesterase